MELREGQSQPLASHVCLTPFEFSYQQAVENQTFQRLLDENPGSSSKLEGDICPGTKFKVLCSRPLC